MSDSSITQLNQHLEKLGNEGWRCSRIRSTDGMAEMMATCNEAEQLVSVIRAQLEAREDIKTIVTSFNEAVDASTESDRYLRLMAVKKAVTSQFPESKEKIQVPESEVMIRLAIANMMLDEIRKIDAAIYFKSANVPDDVAAEVATLIRNLIDAYVFSTDTDAALENYSHVVSAILAIEIAKSRIAAAEVRCNIGPADEAAFVRGDGFGFSNRDLPQLPARRYRVYPDTSEFLQRSRSRRRN